MVNKLVINCLTGDIEKQNLTDKEISQQELEYQKHLEQELMESLKPSEKEVLMAEIELNIINLLIESGVI